MGAGSLADNTEWLGLIGVTIALLMCIHFAIRHLRIAQRKGNGTSKSGKSFEDFLESFGLKKHWRHKLSLVDAMTVQDVERLSDNALIDSFIAKLTSYDYRVCSLGNLFLERGIASLLNDEGNLPNENTSGAVEDKYEGSSWLDETENTDNYIEQKNSQSSRDILFGILSCLDPFLLQETLMKLSACQVAVPVLMPQYEGQNVTFLLWGLRKITKTWHTVDASIQTKPVVSHPFLTVTALRIGEIGLSKSNVLNRLLGPAQGNDEHAFFISLEQSSSAAIWSQGVLECVWFTPKPDTEKNQISLPLALFNLRGDGLKFNKQAEFCRFNSFATIIFVSDKDVQTYKKDIEKFKDFSYVILVRCPVRNVSTTKRSEGQKKLSESGVTVINAEGITALEISKLISMALKKAIMSVNCKQHCVLEDASNVCQDMNIDIDESMSACSSSKKEAKELIQLIKTDLKTNHFRFQSLWREWTKIDKENILEQKGKSIEEKICSKNQKKNALRCKQARLEPSNAVKQFLKLVNISDEIKRKFVLIWIQIFLNELSSSTLKPLVAKLSKVSQQKREKSSQINKLRLYLENNENIDTTTTHHLNTLTKEENSLIAEEKELISDFEKHSIGLEHFIRELGQIAESNVYRDEKYRLSNEHVQNLPTLAANLLLEGFPIEILDGDANYVPVSWVRAVIDALIKVIGKDAKVYVISVLGIQNSGKSTLLNSMFGVRFAVSAGRCTRGAFLQLIPVHSSMKEYLKCEYIAIVDTEGLQAPERLVSNSLEHDNELATFALCIADLTLINIGGQTMGEGMTNILEIAATALIRMKEVELNSECRIVQQFVADLTAEEKNETAMQGIFIKLDEAIRNAAKDEGKQNKYRQFSDVFTVQNYSSDSKNVQYIPNLWRGLMSAPDYQYSVKVQRLKSALLCSISNKIGVCLTLKEFSSRVFDVWTAIKKENFVFSFHNTKEVSLYEEFMLIYRGWLQLIRVSLMEKQVKMRSKIENAAGEIISKFQNECLAEINSFIEEECKKVQDKVGTSLKSDKYLPVRKHSFYFYADLDAFKLDMWSTMLRQLESFSELNRNEEQKTVEISSLSQELHGKVFLVAEVFKHTLEDVNNSKKDVNEIIDDKFEEVWKEWMCEKRQRYELRSIGNIYNSTKDVIIKTITKDCRRRQVEKYVHDRLETPLGKFSSSTNSVIFLKDVEELEKLFNDFDSNLNTAFQNIHEEITKVSRNHADFETNALKLATISKMFVSNPKILAKDTLVNLIFAVFLSRTQHYQECSELLRLLQSKVKLKEFAKIKGLIAREEIQKCIEVSLFNEFRTSQNLSQSETKDLREAWEDPDYLQNEPILAFDDSGIISISVRYLNNFVSNVASKLFNVTQWLETIQHSFQRAFETLEKQFKDKLCTKMCIDIFAKMVVSLCSTKLINLKGKYQIMSFVLKWGTSRFTKSFDECLKHHISSKDYKMQFAEPVHASNIEAKISTLLALFAGRDMLEMKNLEHVLTPQNVEKYSNLPFDVALLQCLDKTFVEMLPTNDRKNLNLIHRVVNRQKKSLLSGKQYLAPFNPSTLSKQLTEIINRNEDDVFTNDVKSLAIVHISAWILPVCSVLQYEYEKSKNLAVLLEKEKTMMHVHFRSLCSESQDKLIAETFCNIVKSAISDGLNHKICPLLFKQFMKGHNAFRSKRVFLGTVFKDLCERDDFQGIVGFLKDFTGFSQNWILNYLSTHCNAVGNSLLKCKTNACIDQLVEDAHCCVINATNKIFQSSNKTLSAWLDIFLQQFLQSTDLSCKEQEIDKLKTYLTLNKCELFVRECHKLINDFGKSLKEDIHLPQEGNVTCTKKFLLDLPTQIHVEVFDSLKGCTAQCPFCGAVCDDSLVEHQKHATSCHFPYGLNGWKWIYTGKLVITICTSAVLSDAVYRIPFSNEIRPYRKYQKDYPDWFIRGVEEQEPTKFWKYIFKTYNSDCASLYNCSEADIPSEWEHITKEEALASLDSAYNL